MRLWGPELHPVDENFALVLGELWSHIGVTLLNVQQFNKIEARPSARKPPFPQYESWFRFDSLVYNYTFSSLSAVKGKSFDLKFDNLGSFFGYGAFRDLDNLPSDISFKLNEASCRVRYLTQSGSSISKPNYWTNTFHLITVNTKNFVSYETLRKEYVQPLEDFFSFALGVNIRVESTRIDFKGLDMKKVKTIDSLHHIYPNELWDSHVAKEYRTRGQKLDVFSMRSRFGMYLRNWIEAQQNFGTVFEGYFAIFYSSAFGEYPNTTYLTLTQAIESYCRSKNLSDSSIGGLNGRIFKLLTMFGGIKLIAYLDLKNTALELNQKRQYLSHGNPAEVYKLSSGKFSLEQSIDIAKLLLELIFLREMGMGIQKINKIVEHQPYFTRYKNFIK